MINGWMFSPKMGVYGTDYIGRAVATAFGQGRTVRMMQSIPLLRSMPTANPMTGPTNMSCTSIKRRCLRQGFWPLTMYNDQYFFWTIRSTVTSSVRGISSLRMRTVRWTCIRSLTLPARPRRPTGCLRRREDSFQCYGCIGQERLHLRSSMALGQHLRLHRSARVVLRGAYERGFADCDSQSSKQTACVLRLCSPGICYRRRRVSRSDHAMECVCATGSDLKARVKRVVARWAFTLHAISS